MQRIGGIDFSLTKTGVAIATQRVNGEVIMNTSTVTSRGAATDTYVDKSRRLDNVTLDVYRAFVGCELVVMESLSLGSRGGDLDRFWAAWWMLYGRFVKADIPVALVSPTSLKLAIAGKAQVDKSVLGRHVVKLWPDLEYANDNEADGAGLVHLGAVALGWNVSTLERHKAVKWTEWPEFGPAAQLVALPMDDVKEVS
jgi:Holliday junction resolvasome RuvABC endonuclease subunit